MSDKKRREDEGIEAKILLAGEKQNIYDEDAALGDPETNLNDANLNSDYLYDSVFQQDTEAQVPETNFPTTPIAVLSLRVSMVNMASAMRTTKNLFLAQSADRSDLTVNPVSSVEALN